MRNDSPGARADYSNSNAPTSQNDPPGSGRKYQFKTLRLNFWRPGDSVLEHEDEVRYGIPVEQDPDLQAEILKKYGQTERLDHMWLYR